MERAARSGRRRPSSSSSSSAIVKPTKPRRHSSSSSSVELVPATTSVPPKFKPIATVAVLVVSALILILLLLMPFVHAVSTSQAYRRTVVEDAELAETAATLTTNGTLLLENSTLIQCAGWCSKTSDCAAYSFRRSSVYGGGGGGGDRGLCRLGTNPYDKRKRAGSKIYFLSGGADSNPAKDDGFTYYRVAGLYTFHQARTYCVLYDHGNLPVVYPNSVSFRKMNASFLLSTDKAFVDMRSIGDYKFITGLGEIVDARNKDNDPNQHWAPGMPTAAAAAAASNSSGRFVLMGRTGWEDVAATATCTVIACQSDTASYRLIPETGRYYFLKQPPATVPNARRTCQAEGGRLAVTYGTADGRFPVFDEYAPTIVTDYVIVSGTMNVVPFQIMEFDDGTRMNYTNQATIDQDPRQNWYLPYRLANYDCLHMSRYGWRAIICSELRYFLCERDSP